MGESLGMEGNVAQVGSERVFPTVAIVMPAYNAELTLAATVESIPEAYTDLLILVDDASGDRTVAEARRLNLVTAVHAQNRGYGGNQKTCYATALAHGADIVAMLHPDNQYDPAGLPELLEPILAGRADVVLGSRLSRGWRAAKAHGMPLWRYLGNRLLTATQNLLLGTSFTELHTGMRAYTRQFLEESGFQGNTEGFLFDAEMVLTALRRGYRIEEVPAVGRYFPEASSMTLGTAVAYGLRALAISVRHCLQVRMRAQAPIPVRESKAAPKS